MGMLMLWGAPRSRSTAFYRMMVERGDFTVVFEPFSHAAVFGQAEIGGRPLATGPEILAELRSLAATRPIFIKEPPTGVNPRLHEIGCEAQYEAYAKVRRLTGRDPLVVDAADLMSRPADVIMAYCARAGIDFRPHALNWQPSGRPEWQGGFSHWFTGVAASSGLAAVPGRRRLDVGQHPLLDTYLRYHLPFYQKLYQRRLVV